MAASPPIIIIKKKGGHGGHHGGAWKVAYADFVTAMMALFIVLWLMHASPDVQKAVSGYFKDPRGTGKRTGTAVGGSGEGVAISKDNMEDLKQKLEQAIRKKPEFEKLKNNVEMTITGEGLRIELIERERELFFETGQSAPTPVGKDLLRQLAQQLASLRNPLVIEGHTDSKPYGSTTYTNWELSADRANSARRVMQEAGVGAEQVKQVRGFADQQPRESKDPQDPTNRRVTIIVHYGDPREEPATAGEEAEAKGEKRVGGDPKTIGKPEGESNKEHH